MKRIFIFTMCILLSAGAFGQVSEKKQYTANRVLIPPSINGILDEEAWQKGNWEGNFIQNQPYSGRTESQRTEFKILFDDDNLYVAIKAYDTCPDSIVNRLSRRDQQDGDLVGIIIDSFHDLRTGFLFGVSSTGVKYDHMMTNDGQNDDPSWDPNWWVRTSINSEGWFAEMKIPFSQVRFEKNSDEVWGINVGRVLYRKNETTYWQHIPKEASGLIHLFGELKGLEKIKPRKIFDITPYSVARTETFQKVASDPFRAKGSLSSLNGGINAKIGVTNNMTMDLTINPDFGQVEADPSEVNLSAYETFFNEKRLFFIEGSNITNFSLGTGDGSVGNDNLFYSRRIGRKPQVNPALNEGWNADVPIQSTILGAVKLTGKSKNGLSVGFVEALTARMQADIDTNGGRMTSTAEPLTNYMVGRIQKDINNGNTLIGGIITSTNRVTDADVMDFMHKAAYSGGLDFTQYFDDKNWMFNLNTAFTLVEGTAKAIENTQRSSAHYFQCPDKSYSMLDTTRTSLSGSGGRMQIRKLNGHWNFQGVTTWKTPGFEANDLGYMRESDQILSVLWAQYNQYEPGWIYRKYNINWDIYSIWNFGGRNLSRGFEWSANMERINVNLSPDLTLQYWGQPFFATGRYYDQKMITDPVAARFNDRFHTYGPDQIRHEGYTCNIDENSDGTTDYSFDNRDFNFQEFLSNLVVRWEYNPGSSVYLVWSQTRTSSGNPGNLDIMNDLGNLFNADDNKPHNVFLIKFTYRFGLK